jgi:hypothetical protein
VKGYKILGLYLALRDFEYREGIFIVPHMLWLKTLVFPFSSEGPPHSLAFYDSQGDKILFLQPIYVLAPGVPNYME